MRARGRAFVLPALLTVLAPWAPSCSSKSSGGAAGRGGATGAAGQAGSPGAAGAQGGGSTLAGCRLFPADNPWNQDISGLPLHPMNATFIANMNASRGVHPDWGKMTDFYGIPYTSGTGATPQPLTWTTSWGAGESEMLPCPTGTNKFCYPIPLSAPIEGGPQADSDADRHILYVDTAGGPDDCTLYELYQVQNQSGSGFKAANGAIFHLGSNTLRPDGWTSADAAGLPILPGLVRLDEVMAGEIRHAIRFTVDKTQKGFIHPATHQAGQDNTAYPPMGLRMRLKASVDVSRYSAPTQIILNAMKRYGIILADNGTDWYITGESNNGWGPYMDDLISDLNKIHGNDFEAVDTGPIVTTTL